jgi:hypothetical protein
VSEEEENIVSSSKQTGSREWVAERMLIAIRKAKWRGARLSVADEAARLLKHPACRLPLKEIREEILSLAVSERMPMELDSLVSPGEGAH